MSRESALARVIGLTKSLSPLGHGGHLVPIKGSVDTESTDAVVEAASANQPADAAQPAEAVQPAEAAPAGKDEAADGPALAQVTVVAGDMAPMPDDPVRQAVTDQAIGDIEADIASLLATLDGNGTMPRSDARALSDMPALLADDGDEAVAGPDADDYDAATLVLLSELDRLWRADPAVGNSYMR